MDNKYSIDGYYSILLTSILFYLFQVLEERLLASIQEDLPKITENVFEKVIFLDEDSAIIKVNSVKSRTTSGESSSNIVKFVQDRKRGWTEAENLQRLSANTNSRSKYIIPLLGFCSLEDNQYYNMAILFPYYPLTGREFSQSFQYSHLCRFLYQLLQVYLSIYLSIYLSNYTISFFISLIFVWSI